MSLLLDLVQFLLVLLALDQEEVLLQLQSSQLLLQLR